MREIRGGRIATIFQNPMSSMNPVYTIENQIGEAIKLHQDVQKQEIKEKVVEILDKVGIPSPRERMKDYPHEYSGGQKQRIGIARALAGNPKLLVADEPVSSLDVSVRAQILNLLNDLQEEFGFTYLYISHDLSTVKHMCDRVAVMYVGKLVELASVKDVYNNPIHPYTEALMSAIPIPGRRREDRIILKGTVPTPIDPPPGCRFNPRCQYCEPECAKKDPEFIEVKKGRFVACHLRK